MLIKVYGSALPSIGSSFHSPLKSSHSKEEVEEEEEVDSGNNMLNIVAQKITV
jgi:hypothetical protein